MRSSSWCLFLVVMLCLAPRSARADYQQTEARLKAVGIKEPPRRKIHAAIDRGVAYLLSQQQESGAFRAAQPALAGALSKKARKKLDRLTEQSPGVSVLCALALRHADTPKAKKGLSRARAFLFANNGVRKRLLARTYEGGLAAMLIMADGGPEDLAGLFARRLVGRQAASGWWGYGSVGPGSRWPANLSTTQFAALGLWAASRVGAKVPAHVWKRLAKRHCKTQGEQGGWGYKPKPPEALWPYPIYGRYPQGTFMGIANVILAEAALARTLKKDKVLSRDLAAAKAAGLIALERDGVTYLKRMALWDGHSPIGVEHPLDWPYYGLYSLAKACIFAGLERCGKIPWYQIGAAVLLGHQRENGAWGPVQLAAGDHTMVREEALVATSFALLFLLRASAVYRPGTPTTGSPSVPPGGK